MNLVIALDAGPLGLLTHRKDNGEAEHCRNWLTSRLTAGDQAIVPAIADYEVRRELIRARKMESVARLDAFLNASPERYVSPIGNVFRKAAELWAEIRNQGLPTASDTALDADVILAAQLLMSKFAGDNLIVATTNPKHISWFLKAQLWQEIL